VVTFATTELNGSQLPIRHRFSSRSIPTALVAHERDMRVVG